jgi:hypothetical protein
MAEPANSKTFPFDKSPSGAKSNFKSSGDKKNVKGKPSGSKSSPWLYGADRGADYSRTSSNKNGMGPGKPSNEIPGSIYGEDGSSRAGQKKHI